MKSKRKIKQQMKRKTNSEIVETIKSAKLQKGWMPLAAKLSGGKRNYPVMNLDELEKATKEGDTVVVPGKVLSLGEIKKKIRIAALSFSTNARAKLHKSKSEVISINDEIKSNPSAKGVKILP